MGKRWSGPVALAVGVVFGVTAVGGVAMASGSKGKQVQACVDNKTGAVRIAGKCTAKEHKQALGQVGPHGAKGPAGGQTDNRGPGGPTGPVGPQGDDVTLPMAVVQPDGHGGITSSATVSAWKLATGRFCVAPTAAGSGFENVQPLVTPVVSSNAQQAVAYVVADALSCGSAGTEVDTKLFDATSHTLSSADVAFNLVLGNPQIVRVSS